MKEDCILIEFNPLYTFLSIWFGYSADPDETSETFSFDGGVFTKHLTFHT